MGKIILDRGLSPCYAIDMTVFKTGDLVRKKHMEWDKHTLALVLEHNEVLEGFNRLKVCFLTDRKTEMVRADHYEVVSKNKQL